MKFYAILAANPSLRDLALFIAPQFYKGAHRLGVPGFAKK